MNLKLLAEPFTVCKLEDESQLEYSSKYYFVGKTDEEISLVCPTPDVPDFTEAREDGWRCFKIQGELDFSMIGVLSHLTSILAAEDMPLFAVSTFNTDYIFVKEDDLSKALFVLEEENHTVQFPV
ncbi:MAG: ACT domain-containing protein [Bacillota bacterium]|nr:ACT domain-containing protein [Bacillota bacterium]